MTQRCGLSVENRVRPEAYAGVLGGEVVECFPDEVSEVAHGESPQRGVVDVGPDLESVVRAGEPHPGARRFVGTAVL
jgi:hypothetical protein